MKGGFSVDCRIWKMGQSHTPSRGSGGMPPPGKFWISDLLRSFLVQSGNLAGVQWHARVT